MKKKSLSKLSLSRETLRTLADVAPAAVVGGAKESPLTMTNCPYHTNCDYTYSCPALCPSLARTCVSA
jgi:hypothetical protein